MQITALQAEEISLSTIEQFPRHEMFHHCKFLSLLQGGAERRTPRSADALKGLVLHFGSDGIDLALGGLHRAAIDDGAWIGIPVMLIAFFVCQTYATFW